ncbi:MAG: hypothetical protein M1819_003086 [Sarea resinae]|nr:MAG: hypothetical protein M1819_003086 [Sarea resinae]
MTDKTPSVSDLEDISASNIFCQLSPNSTCIPMLSNPSNNLQHRQRQHRRQNSTPKAFNAPKVPILPATPLQRNGSRRRGLSMDRQQSPQRQQRRQSTQDDKSQALQEAQQQRLFRPGQQPDRPLLPQRQGFDSQSNQQQQFDAQFQQSNLTSCLSISSDLNPDNSFFGQNAQDRSSYLEYDFDMSNPAGRLDGFGLGLSADGKVNIQEKDQRLCDVEADGKGGVMNASSQSLQSNWHTQQQRQRPVTPPLQSNSSYAPITPATTPYQRISRAERATVQHLPSNRDGDDTVKASRSSIAKRPLSCQEIFPLNGRGYNNEALPSPPNTAPLKSSSTFDLAPMPNPNFMDTSAITINFGGSDVGYDSSCYSPESSNLSPRLSSLASSPELAQMSLFDDPWTTLPNLSAPAGTSLLPSSQSATELYSTGSPSKEALSERASSIADLSLDATIEDTGITVDDIATYIDGPDLVDGKWTCRYPECNKKFGRKENIKSHVQTHLGDRQYRCNHCQKCFVRQHDLKRHAKIHSGVKPYPCLCGNSFARHDALTRHRQRGMCIGAFEGVVKKVAKRGRPRKNRPAAEDRLDKSSRTRKRVAARTYASSTSGGSDCSFAQSPRQYDNSSTRDSSPFDQLPQLMSDFYTFSSETVASTPPTSPGHSFSAEEHNSPNQSGQTFASTPLPASQQESNAYSPSQKRGSMASIPEEQTTEAQEQHSNPASPAQSGSSLYGTPPELCPSSPPTAADFFDFDAMSDFSSGGSQERPSRMMLGNNDDDNNFGFSKMDSQDDVDNFFSDPFAPEANMTALEKDPSLLLLEKFEDAFNNDDELNSNRFSATDMFFAS